MRILPTGLIPKTTQNCKPLWVPNPKIPVEFRLKPNPYPKFGSDPGITLGYPNFGYPILTIIDILYDIKNMGSNNYKTGSYHEKLRILR